MKLQTKNVTDMTVGNPTKLILQFTIPLLIGNLFQQVYSLVDSIVVGKYVGDDALAAIGTCSSVNFLFIALCTGLANGIGVLISQYFGAQQEEKVRAIIANAFYILITVAIVTTTLGMIFSRHILKLMNTPVENGVLDNATMYLRTVFAGILALAVYNGVAAILRALGDSRTPLYFLILSSIVNIVLDLLMVRVFHKGVLGVGMATVFAQIISALASLLYAFIRIPYFKVSRELRKPDRDIIRRVFRIGVPMALQSAMISISTIVLQSVVNGYREKVMAAYTISCRVDLVLIQPYISVMQALTTYAGQNIGADKVDRVKMGYRKCMIIIFLFNVVMIPLIFAGSRLIVGTFASDPETIRIGTTALRINSICYLGLGAIYPPRGIVNGCGDAAFSVINGITEVACRVVYSMILTRIPAIGMWGIWLTAGLTWITVAVICQLRYASGVWQRTGRVRKVA